MMKYDELKEQIVARHQELNPVDHIVSYPEVEYKYDEKFNRPTLLTKKGEFSLDEWAHGQLCGRLGIPNGYINKCPPDLKEDNINYFLKHRLGDLKLRTIKENRVRAVLTPSYTSIDDYDLIDLIQPFMVSREIEIISCYHGELMTSFRGVFVEQEKVAIEIGDPTKRGVMINNSEVGYMAVQFRAFMYRLVCTNGLVLPRDVGGFHFRHRGNKDRIYHTCETIVNSLDEHLEVYFNKFQNSREVKVSDPLMIIQETVKKENWPKKWEDIFVSAYNIEPHESLFGIINAFTRGAQKLKIHQRVQIEEYATELLREVA